MRLAPVFADVDGLRVHYYASGPGDGLPVVLIHEWASSRRMLTSTRSEALGDYRYFALDLPGHGTSDRLLKSGKASWKQLRACGHHPPDEAPMGRTRKTLRTFLRQAA